MSCETTDWPRFEIFQEAPLFSLSGYFTFARLPVNNDAVRVPPIPTRFKVKSIKLVLSWAHLSPSEMASLNSLVWVQSAQQCFLEAPSTLQIRCRVQHHLFQHWGPPPRFHLAPQSLLRRDLFFPKLRIPSTNPSFILKWRFATTRTRFQQQTSMSQWVRMSFPYSIPITYASGLSTTASRLVSSSLGSEALSWGYSAWSGLVWLSGYKLWIH